MRHTAWLNSKAKGETKSRLTILKEQADRLKKPLDTPLPDIEGFEYLVAFLHEAGTASSSGMGVTGLSWTELKSWKELSGVSITEFEMGLVKRLSDAYASEYGNSNGENTSPPYVSLTMDEIERNREAIGNKVESALMALIADNSDEDIDEDN